jgi:4-amino-4-deoxy-L-arabinose transferase-like glycosyltransferase
MTGLRLAGRAPAPASTLQAPAGARAQLVFDDLYVAWPRRWLAAILLAYLSAALLYASLTPVWQNPDEPAHYNYIKHIATHGSLPVLHEGDFDLSLITFLQRARAGTHISVDALEYESYQPPLYYLTATPVYLLADGRLLALRLYSVALGLASLLLLYACLALVFPNKPLIPLGATAFAGLLPMHVAVMASVTNDVMAELLTMAAAYVLLRWMRPYFYVPEIAAGTDTQQEPHDRRHLFSLGLLLGLGLITKIYAYALLPMCVLLVVWTIWRGPRSWRAAGRGLGHSLWTLVPAIFIALPMWVRNLSLYGGWDFLGLQWHDRVVQGQLTTARYIAQIGTLHYFEEAFGLTFRSFWGVFGWMTIAMDARIYQAAFYFTGVLFLGLLWASVRLISGPPDTDMDAFQTSVIALLGLLIVAVAVPALSGII